MTHQRYTQIMLNEMAIAEKLKAEAEAAKKEGIAREVSRLKQRKRAVPDGFDCAPEEVGRAMHERSEREASQARARARQQRQQGIGR